jgi:hypothetical protein
MNQRSCVGEEKTTNPTPESDGFAAGPWSVLTDQDRFDRARRPITGD